MFTKKIPFVCKECKYSAYTIQKYVNHVILVHMTDKPKKKLQSNQSPRSKKRTKSQFKKRHKKCKTNSSTDILPVLNSELPQSKHDPNFSDSVSSPETVDSLSAIKLRKFSLASEMPIVKNEVLENVNQALNFSFTDQDAHPANKKQARASCPIQESQSKEKRIKLKILNGVDASKSTTLLSTSTCGVSNLLEVQKITEKIEHSDGKLRAERRSSCTEQEHTAFVKQLPASRTGCSSNCEILKAKDTLSDSTSGSSNFKFFNLKQSRKRSRKSIISRSFKAKHCATESNNNTDDEKSIDHSVYKESILSDIFPFMQDKTSGFSAKNVLVSSSIFLNIMKYDKNNM